MTKAPADPGRANPVEEDHMASRKGTDGLFRSPAPLTAMDRTTSEARHIIDEQTARRQELTAKLRAERMARDAGANGRAPATKAPET